MDSRKIVIGLSLLLLFVNVQAQVDTSRRRPPLSDPDGTPKPDKTSKPKKEGSGFLNSLFSNLAAEQRRKDSLNKYYREHPVKTNKYIETYLVEKRVLPNSDAIALIKALNPNIKNLEEINFYAELRMPVFKKINKPERKRLKKECKQLIKYHASTQREFIHQYNSLQNAINLFNRSDIRFTSSATKREFGATLATILGYLDSYSKTKLQKGTALSFSKQTTTIVSLLNDISGKKTASNKHLAILNSIEKDLHYPLLKQTAALQKNTFPAGNVNRRSEREGLWTAASADNDLIDHDLEKTSEIFTADFAAEENITTKTCEIYAKKASPDGRPIEIEIQKQYFFSFLPHGTAEYNCFADNCNGFNEGPELVSINGANIIPNHYVFRFRDRTTNKIYSRCYTKDLFEVINGVKGNDKRNYRIIFNPDTGECTDYLSR